MIRWAMDMIIGIGRLVDLKRWGERGRSGALVAAIAVLMPGPARPDTTRFLTNVTPCRNVRKRAAAAAARS